MRSTPLTNLSKLFGGTLAGMVLGFVPSQVLAQAQAPVPSQTAGTPASQQPDAVLKAQFASGFTRGCLTSPGNTLANKQAFCSCVLSAYQTRYNGQALAAIVSLASQAGPSGPRLVDLLMLPERNACIARNR